MVTPCRLPLLPALALFVDHEVTMEIIFRHPVAMTADESDIKSAKASTHILLHSMFRTRMHTDRRDFPVLFRPSTKGNRDDWHTSTSGEYPATNLSPSTPFHEVGIVRSRLGLFVYHGREMHTAHELEEEGSNEATSHLKCWPFPKRLDLLHPLVGSSPQNNTFVYLKPEECTVDNLPLKYATFARMIPSIMHHVNRQSMVDRLSTGLLSPVQFTSKENLLSVMTASSAREGNNYQRLEFLGDATLKYVTALTLMAHHPQWHEGYLSRMKDHIVSNGSLALAAQTTGLVRYIATRQFTAHKWRPMYNDDLLADHAVTKRELTSKVMVDVIEAIIGAAYVDGGLPKALAILGIFLPQVKWQPLKELTATLQQAALPAGSLVGASSPQIVRLEQLLVHTFDDKALLLEAITHGSCTMSKVPSYQRLEYLGDAVLDYIVTNIIFNHHKQPPVYLMHRLRIATVNAGFLAFRALSTTTPILTAQIDTFMPSADTSSPAFKQTISNPSLLDFLQKAHIPNLNAALNATRSRYNLLQPLLALALDEGNTYPWRLLAAFNPDKIVSDIVESILGAVFIDSGGDFAAVEKVARTLGLWDWLERALGEDVKCWHPKEEIGTFGSMGGESGVVYKVWRSQDVESHGPSESEGSSADEEDNDDDGMNEQRQLELGKGTWHCRVVVNGEDICVTHGWNRLEVETAAAEEAITILKVRKVPQVPQAEVAASIQAVEEEGETADDGSEDEGAMLDG
jgi:dsRNA-specific ribonuclease